MRHHTSRFLTYIATLLIVFCCLNSTIGVVKANNRSIEPKQSPESYISENVSANLRPITKAVRVKPVIEVDKKTGKKLLSNAKVSNFDDPSNSIMKKIRDEKLAAADNGSIRINRNCYVNVNQGFTVKKELTSSDTSFSPYFLIQFKSDLASVNKETRNTLEKSGVVLLEYISNDAFYVKIPRNAHPIMLALLKEGKIKYFGEIPAEARGNANLISSAKSKGEQQIPLAILLFEAPTDLQLQTIKNLIHFDRYDAVLKCIFGNADGNSVESLFKLDFVKRVDEVGPIHSNNALDSNRPADIAPAITQYQNNLDGTDTKGAIGDTHVIRQNGQVPPTFSPNSDNGTMPLADIAADIAQYQSGLDGTGIKVAINDTGIAQQNGQFHPAFSPSRIINQNDFKTIPPDDDIADDAYGHGTHVAGIIGGQATTQTGNRYLGVAPNSSLLVYKTAEHIWDVSQFNRIVTRAAQNSANIMNNSWSSTINIGLYDTTSETADHAVRGEYLDSAGDPCHINMVVAAGNDANRVSENPATAKNVITVGALKTANGKQEITECSPADPNFPPGQTACFSNFGPIDTNGDGNTRVKPDVVAPGVGITSTTPWYDCDWDYETPAHPKIIDIGDYYGHASGTSMAAPFVSGTIALLLQSSPSLIDWPEEVKAKLINTARFANNNDPGVEREGFGVVDAYHLINDDAAFSTLCFVGSSLTFDEKIKEYPFNVPNGCKELKVTLTWSDPPSSQVVNDLDLLLYDPDGNPVAQSVTRDDVVEQVVVLNPGSPGVWKAKVCGTQLNDSPQYFGLAAGAIMTETLLSFSATSDKTYIEANDTVKITTTVNNLGHTSVGTFITLDKSVSSQFDLLSVDIYRADGSKINLLPEQLNVHTEPDGKQVWCVPVGEVVLGYPRRVDWILFSWPTITDGSHTIPFVCESRTTVNKYANVDLIKRPPLSQPTLDEPANSSVQFGTSVNFKWDAYEAATDYELVVSAASGGVFFSDWVGNVTTKTLSGFPNNGTQYNWKVLARTARGDSPFTTVRTFTNGLNNATGKIVFSSDRDGTRQIYTMNIDGTNLKRLTYDNCDHQGPSWSPDGQWVAFCANTDQWHVYIMKASDNTTLQQLPSISSGPEVSWSPDGKWIAYNRSQASHWAVYKLEVANPSNQINLSNTPGSDSFAPHWSPDGTKIAFGSNRDGTQRLYTMDADGQNQMAMTTSPYMQSGWSWSPDGTKIAFTATSSGNTYQLYTIDATTPGSPWSLISVPEAVNDATCWTPYGIIFTSNNSGNYDLYIVDPGNPSSSLGNLTNNSAWNYYTDFSPHNSNPTYTLPTSSTADAADVLAASATLIGTLITDGGESCQYRFCRGTSPGVYTDNTTWSTVNKTTGQSFSASIRGLLPGTKYYYIAECKNSAGTGTGSEISFTTLPGASITLTAVPDSIVANGTSTSTLTATVRDQYGNPVPNGTSVVFTTSRGTVGSGTKLTSNGVATTTLTSEVSTQIVVADVSATANSISKTVAVFFTPPSSPPITDNKTETVSGTGTIIDTSSGGSITVDATGSHTVTTAKYGGNPGGTPSFQAAGNYYDVHVDNTVNLNTITIQFSPATASTVIYYWTGSTWVAASNQTYIEGIVTVTVTSETTPNLANLSGLFFGSGTSLTLPAITNTPATSIMSTTAILHGNLTSTGGAAAKVAIFSGPSDGSWTRSDNLTNVPVGPFSLGVTGLTPGTTYVYRCYAENTAGGAWASSSINFTTQANLGLWRNYWAGPGADWHWFSSGGP